MTHQSGVTTRDTSSSKKFPLLPRMRSVGNKLVSVLTALALAFIGVTALGAAPASASIRPTPTGFTTNYATLGQPFDADYSCVESDPNSPPATTLGLQYGNGGTLPPGLELDLADGHIKGTPTQVGKYILPLVQCSDMVSYGVGEIWVGPERTPNPSFSITSLNSYDCSYNLAVSFPEVPDYNTAKITISNGSTTLVATLGGTLEADNIYDIPFSFDHIDRIGGQFPVTNMETTVGSTMLACNSDVTLEFSYQYLHAPAGFVRYGWHPQTRDPYPSVSAESLGDSQCTVRVNAVYPSILVNTDVAVQFFIGTKSILVMFNDATSGKLKTVDVPLANLDAIRALPGVTSVDSTFTDGIVCENTTWDVSVYSVTEAGDAYSRSDMVTTHITPVACAAGTFSATGNAPCTVAPKGSYVAGTGATSATLCPLGTFSKVTSATACIDAAKGYYVDKLGATKATKCKKGYGTELAGSRSSFECHKQIFQTAKAIKPAKKLKVGGKIETAARTDAGNALDATVTGPCTLVAKTVTVKVKGKKVKQPRWVIKAGTETGTCKVTYTNAGDYTYKPFKVTKTIKVTKTGK